MTAVQRISPPRMTVAEFLRWDSGDWSGRRWQLADGEPVAMDPASQTHGAITSEINGLIREHLIRQGSSCRIITEPGIIPRAGGHENYRVPDLGVTCSTDTSSHATPEPVVLIEVLSPSNFAQTRSNMWTYTTIPSVAEVLIIHSTRLEAELLRRGADGEWPEAPQLLHPPATLELASIGFSVPVAALYRTTGLV